MIKLRERKPKRRAEIDERVYTDYKEELSEDFKCKCGYCYDHHKYYGNLRGSHIDHLKPKKKFPELEDSYHNLVYSCPYCNTAKSDSWVLKKRTKVDEITFVDPCKDTYDSLFCRDDFGRIHFIEGNEASKLIYIKLKLYLARHAISYMATQLNQILKDIDNIRYEKATSLDRDTQDKLSYVKSVFDKYDHELYNTEKSYRKR